MYIKRKISKFIGSFESGFIN